MAKKKDETGVAVKDKETTPEGEPETTPEAKPETTEEIFNLTQQEIDDKVNAGKAPLGRDLKSALEVNTTLKRTIDGQSTRITGLETAAETDRKARREKEMTDAEGNTPVIDGLKLKHTNEDDRLALSKERSDFNQERTQHQVDIDEMAKTKAEKIAEELAKESGLTADLLLSIGSDTDKDGRTTYNLDRMKTIASKSPKVEEESEEETAGSPVKGQRAKAASTGKTATNLRTMADYDQAFASGLISREEYQKARQRFLNV